MKNKKIKIEVCANHLMSAIAAQKGGAERVELCENLAEGGTTPGYGSIVTARKLLTIGLNVLIRPRGGDFLYNDIEFEVMQQDILFCKNNGIDGVVIGMLYEDGSIDIQRTEHLIGLARPMSVTFHRAFDMAADPFGSLNDLIKLGVDRLLTSGQQNTAFDGRHLIAGLVECSVNKILIMPGGGINENNLADMISFTKASEYHVSARSMLKSNMKFRKPHIHISGKSDNADYELSVTDDARISEIVRIAGGNYIS
ncbi:MAG: copper homeostasis protein CutC [Bacteroidia bacterium]|nr:copper homeostasis protein CutC [Bacteroidia bacterium]